MREFGVLFDGGAWIVMEKYQGGGPARQVQVCPTLEIAIKEVHLLTGSPVLLKLVTES